MQSAEPECKMSVPEEMTLKKKTTKQQEDDCILGCCHVI
jgi:hypothetical protein